MYRFRKWVKNVFGFSSSQTNGFLLLLPLMVIMILSEPLFRYWKKNQPRKHENVRKLDSLVSLWEVEKEDTIFVTSKPTVLATYFVFNPNTILMDDLLALGFKESLARKMINYRSKGGAFKIKKDLLKIYGMDTTLYRKMYAFIDLPEKIDFPKEERSFKTHDDKKVAKKIFDLNAADTAQLKAVYGIGEKLSLRILKFREKLGGFISFSQVAEVYGLDTLVVKRLKERAFIASDFKPIQLNVNAEDSHTLSLHPYISRQVSESIVAYRFQHGPFKSLDDLTKIKILDAETISRIKPYLKLND